MGEIMRGYLTIIAGLIVLLPACGGMRNVERKQESMRLSRDSSVHLQHMEIQAEQKVENMVTLRRDSMNNNYSVQIWPKGKFSYSAEHGFEGTAEKILITGEVKRGKRSLITKTVTANKDQLTKTSVDLQGHSNLVKESALLNKHVSWKTVLGYVLVGACFIALLLFLRLVRKQLLF
jgi:hypothetical protein